MNSAPILLGVLEQDNHDGLCLPRDDVKVLRHAFEQEGWLRAPRRSLKYICCTAHEHQCTHPLETLRHDIHEGLCLLRDDAKILCCTADELRALLAALEQDSHEGLFRGMT